jgi:hypothetical protein
MTKIRAARFSGFVICHSSFNSPPYNKSLLPQDFGRRLCGEESQRIYGVGDDSAAGDSLVPPVVEVEVPMEDSVVEAGLVASVVAAGGLVAAGLAAGSVVSVFCSHAAKSAALARMQIYFFIVLIGKPYCFNRLIGARRFLTASSCHSERCREWTILDSVKFILSERSESNGLRSG